MKTNSLFRFLFGLLMMTMGAAFTQSAVLAAASPATITVAPVARTVVSEGSGFTLWTTATGTAPLSYQWYHDNRAIAAATSASHTKLKTDYLDQGAYTVKVTDGNGSVARATGFVNVRIPGQTAVVAWGANWSGQTTVPDGLSNVVAISAGSSHTVALKADGTVVAWGANWDGRTTVPDGLSNVVAISAGNSHTAALKADGTVVAWGNNWAGLTTIPEGLSNVVAISAGGSHTAALKADGTVVAWGDNGYGQITIPEGLSNVVAISAGHLHTVALKADGTVVAWGGYNHYGETTVPEGLSNVLAISAGYYYTVALKADGTVVAWGANWAGETTIPSGLSNVAAISVRSFHTVALKADGTVVAWGSNYEGQTTVPYLEGVAAIAAGWSHTVALITLAAPQVTTPPAATTIALGQGVTFSVKASGSPLYFQWYLNGQAIPGATEASYALNVANAYDTGSYTVKVTNSLGTVTSSPAVLTVTLPTSLAKAADAYDLLYGYAFNQAKTLLDAYITANPAALDVPLARLLRSAARFGILADTSTPAFLKEKLGVTRAEPADFALGNPQIQYPNKYHVTPGNWVQNGKSWEVTGGDYAPACLAFNNQSAASVTLTLKLDRPDDSAFTETWSGTLQLSLTDERERRRRYLGDPSVMDAQGNVTFQLPPHQSALLQFEEVYFPLRATVVGSLPATVEVVAGQKGYNVPRFKPGANLADLFAFFKAQDVAVLATFLADLDAIPASAEVRFAAGDVGSVEDIVVAQPDIEIIKAVIKLLQAMRLLSDSYDFNLDITNGDIFDSFLAVDDAATGDALLKKHPTFLSALAAASPADRAQAKALIQQAIAHYRGVETSLWSRFARVGASVPAAGGSFLITIDPDQGQGDLAYTQQAEISRGLDRFLAVLAGPTSFDDLAAEFEVPGLPLGTKLSLAPLFAAQPFDFRANLPASLADAMKAGPGLLDGLLTSGIVSGITPGQLDEIATVGGNGGSFLFAGVQETDWSTAAGFKVIGVVPHARNDAFPGLAAPSPYVVVVSAAQDDGSRSIARLNFTAASGWTRVWKETHNDEFYEFQFGSMLLGSESILWGDHVISQATGQVLGNVTGLGADGLLVGYSEIFAIPGGYLYHHAGLLTRTSAGEVRWHSPEELKALAGFDCLVALPARGYVSTGFSATTTVLVTDGATTAKSLRWDGSAWSVLWTKGLTSYGASESSITLLSDAHWLFAGRIFSIATGALVLDPTPTIQNSENATDALNGFYSVSGNMSDLPASLFTLGTNAQLKVVSPSAVTSALVASLWDGEYLVTNNGSQSAIDVIGFVEGAAAPGLAASEKFIIVRYSVQYWYYGDVENYARLDWNGSRFTMRWSVENQNMWSEDNAKILDSRYLNTGDGIRSLATGELLADEAHAMRRFSDDYDGLAPFEFMGSDATLLDGFVVGSYWNKFAVNRPRSQLAATAPVITVPASLAQVGSSATLSVTATGSDLSYQWFKDGRPISNADSAQHAVTVATPADLVGYSVRVRNAAGIVTSKIQAAQTITFDALPGKAYGDAPFALRATASSGLSPTFSIVSGPATLNGNTVTITGVGTVVVRASQAGDANYTAAAPAERSFAVSKAAATVTLGSLAQTFNGTARPATATSTPAALAVTLTYDGSATVPVNAGSYAVVGTISESLYQGSATGTLVVAKATQAITFDALPGKAYGDAPFALRATASSGLSPTFSIVSGPATLNGNTVTITGVGTVVVRASQAGDANYTAAAPAERSFAVSKAAATVTLGSLAQTFNGTARPATATSTPAALAVTLTYDGSATVPVNAGSYAVVGTINESLYQGSASGTLVVAKAAQVITFDVLPGKTYGDAPFTLSATANSGLSPTFSIVSGPATLSGNSVTLTGVGTVVVRASQAGDANYTAAAPVERSFAVSKAAATVTLGSLAQIYNGTARPATATSTPAALTVTLTYDGSATVPINAGSYAVVGTISDSLYQGSASGTLVVAKAAQVITFDALLGKIYGDAPFTLNATASSGLSTAFSIVSGPATLSGNSVTLTGVGTVVVRASQSGDANYTAAAPVERSFAVSKAAATVTLGSLAQTFNGTARPATATSTPAALTVTLTYDGSATVPVNAGSYAVTGTISDSLYQGSASGTLVVAKAAQAITFDALPGKAYGDAPFTLNATASSGLSTAFNIVSGPATLNGNSVTLTGVGTVVVRASQSGDANYNAAASVERSFAVIQGAQTITFNPVPDKAYLDAPFALSATTSSGLIPTYSLVSGPATISGDVVTVSGLGTVVVRTTQAGSANYAAASAVEQSFTVGKAIASVTLSNLEQTYTGKALFASTTTTPPGYAVTLTYNGSPTAPTAIGRYTVVGTISDSLYQGSATGTLIISGVPQAITFAALPDKVFGAKAFAVKATASSKLATALSIVSGPATISGTTITLTGAGLVTVRATQAGDKKYAPAKSVERSFTVTKAAQTITFAPPATQLMNAPPIILSASASSKLPVTFSVVSGPAILGGDGKTLSLTGPGAVVVQATQAGNGAYVAAPTLSKTIQVSQVAQSISFKLPRSATLNTTPLTLTASASSKLSVTYTVVSGPAEIGPGGRTLEVSVAGTVEIEARQDGDTVYKPATPIRASIKIN